MNANELQNKWLDVCRQILSDPTIQPAQFNAFVARLKPRAMSSGYMMLTTDDEFIKTWIEKHYIEQIKQALLDGSGSTAPGTGDDD